MSTSILFLALLFLQSNAWYILGIAALSYYLWTKKLSAIFYKWREEREIAKESAHMKKNPEVFAAREQARLAKIQQLQEEYNQQAIKMQEIMKAVSERIFGKHFKFLIFFYFFRKKRKSGRNG